MAEGTSGSLAYIQGGQSSVINGTDGKDMITIQDLVPYFSIAEGDQAQLVQVENLEGLTLPLQAVRVVSGTDGDLVTFMEISNLSLTDGNKTLILETTPLEFYEGEVLKNFSGQADITVTEDGTLSGFTGIYLELTGQIPENMYKDPDLPRGCRYIGGSWVDCGGCQERCLSQ